MFEHFLYVHKASDIMNLQPCCKWQLITFSKY